MTPAAFASWCLTHLATDTWLTEATLARRLAGIKGQKLSAAGLLAALTRAGWVERHPALPDTYAIAERCWLPQKQKPSPAPTENGHS